MSGSPSSIITFGLGDWGSVNLLPTLGFGDFEVAPPVEDVGGTGQAKDDSFNRLKRFHKNRRDQKVADQLEEEELILLLFMSQDN